MRKARKAHSLSVLFTIAVLAAAVFFLFGPADTVQKMQSKPEQPSEKSMETGPEETGQTKVVALTTVLPRARNFDADPEKDGIEVIISPKDAEGTVVATDGTVRASLWRSVSAAGNRTRGELLESWSSVPVSAADYGDIGFRAVLMFTNYTPQPNDYGFFEIELATPDGNRFTAAEVLLSLGIIE